MHTFSHNTNICLSEVTVVSQNHFFFPPTQTLLRFFFFLFLIIYFFYITSMYKFGCASNSWSVVPNAFICRKIWADQSSKEQWAKHTDHTTGTVWKQWKLSSILTIYSAIIIQDSLLCHECESTDPIRPYNTIIIFFGIHLNAQ